MSPYETNKKAHINFYRILFLRNTKEKGMWIENGLPVSGSLVPSIHKVDKQLKRKLEGSLYNRLSSILYDTTQVDLIRRSFNNNKSQKSQFDGIQDYPLVANLRAGLWYGERFDFKCYFKSTDGHLNKYVLSKTRMNFGFAEFVSMRDGVWILDSTRKGKRFPDSFSRTIPIWCCIMNRLMNHFSNLQTKKLDSNLYLPEWIELNEISFIESKIQHIVSELQIMFKDDPTIFKTLFRNLEQQNNNKMGFRSFWISANDYPQMRILPPHIQSTTQQYVNLILFSVSKNQITTDDDDEGSCGPQVYNDSYAGDSFEYIPGAADDEESWSQNLTPQLFWQNKTFIMKHSKGIEDRVSQVVTKHENSGVVNPNNNNNINNNQETTTIVAQEEHKNSLWTFANGSIALCYSNGSSNDNNNNNTKGEEEEGIVIDCKDPNGQYRIPLNKNVKSQFESKVNQIMQRIQTTMTSIKIETNSEPSLKIGMCYLLVLLLHTYSLSKNKHRDNNNKNNNGSTTVVTKEKIKKYYLYICSIVNGVVYPPKWLLNQVNIYFLTQEQFK